jgi:acyl-CoA reductase-like NAD-dependent aldehyde dehydrogenase
LARFGTADQRCTPGTVITRESVHGEFLRRFDEAVRDAGERPGR